MLKSGPIWALGAMSGTSLDGVDAAMILTDGERVLDFGPSAYRPYSGQERDLLRSGLGAWPGDAQVAAVAELVETAHVEVLSRFVGAQLVGFHGQTLAHEPKGRGTHQAGDGAVLAEALQVPVVWDFRSADVALGGQGAPLVPYFHHALARFLGLSEPLALVNLGGVGNVTWVDPALADPAQDGAVLAFDTGPANAPLNDLMLREFGLALDEGGRTSQGGKADEALVKAFLSHSYFNRIPPKSLDRDEFSFTIRTFLQLSPEDQARSFCALAAGAVARGAEHFPRPVKRVLVTGGGRLNPVMMQELQERLDAEVAPVEAAGLDGDMIEAQAFAFLAVRVLRGLPTSGPSTTGVAAGVSGGKISRPGVDSV